MKQVIVLRADIRMSVGKKIAQACHASLGAYKLSNHKKDWESGGCKKVVLKCRGETELKKLYSTAKKSGIACFLVHDAGLTEVEPGTATALGVGPDDDRKIDKITGSLPLV